MKIRPNLIDLCEIKKDIDINIFKNTSNRVNIILGLLIIFIVLLFIYFGIRKKDRIDKIEEPVQYREYEYEEEDEYETPIMYREDAYDLALM